jgi:hypothetical protein
LSESVDDDVLVVGYNLVDADFGGQCFNEGADSRTTYVLAFASSTSVADGEDGG